jgi:hypothetical protein
MLARRKALSLVELAAVRRIVRKISAKKNLFLETGWYRSCKRIPVSKQGFLLFLKGVSNGEVQTWYAQASYRIRKRMGKNLAE